MQQTARHLLPIVPPWRETNISRAFADPYNIGAVKQHRPRSSGLHVWFSLFFGLLFTGLTALSLSAQAPFPPPNQIQVFPVQGLSFGDFYPSGSGGTITVDFNGIRSSSGVTLAGGVYYAAVFEVALIPGRLVSISLGPNVLLTGSNGGSMTLNIGPADKGNSFVTSGGHPFRNPVYIGGTLNVGNALTNPPGSYSGEFFVTFNQN